jgi:Spy/CpxP family protein refolding chaperone
VIVLVLAGALALLASARGEAGQGAAQPPRDPGALTAADVEREFDNFALGQAQRQLNLTEAQFFRFARAYRALQNVKRQAQRERRVLMAELGALIREPGPVQNPDAVLAKIKAIDDLGVQAATRIQRALAAVDGVLNVRQRARFRQFDQQMERRKLELLGLAQANARGRGGPPPAPQR